jgi:hypothetical protein
MLSLDLFIMALNMPVRHQPTMALRTAASAIFTAASANARAQALLSNPNWRVACLEAKSV